MEIEIKTNDMPLEVGVEKAGPQGLSAYEVAKKEGFIGTEEEWLTSLKGEKGDKGDKGDTGEQGIQGERGLQGEQGIQGIQGEKGDKGDKGDKGQDGTNGRDGADGRDGYVQYTAGDNITIENNVISATGGGSDIPIYTLETSRSVWESTTNITASNDADAIARASEIINTIYNSEKKYGGILFYSTATEYQYLFLLKGSIVTDKTTFDFYTNASAYNMNSADQMFCQKQLSITGSWDNDVFTCTSATYIVGNWYRLSDFAKTSYVLTKSNTFSYTPTSDYHPATKKYVDDTTGTLSNLITTDKTNLVSAINEVASSSGGSSQIPIYPFETTLTVSFLNNYTQRFDNTNKTNMQNFLNELYSQNVDMFSILLTVPTGSVIDNKLTYYQFLMFPYRTTCKLSEEPTIMYFSGAYRSDANKNTITMVTFDITMELTWSNHVCTVSYVEYSGYQYSGVSYNDVLTKTNSSYYNPTANFHPATKKYVDDKLTTYSGYDASKTQVLKNINGTLTWVDE